MYINLPDVFQGPRRTGFQPVCPFSPELFHWQSQSNTSVESSTGRRYLRHREFGYTPLLFVRESTPKNAPAAPYYYLGPCRYVSHEGSRPISIVWRLEYPVPARLLRAMARQKVG